MEGFSGNLFRLTGARFGSRPRKLVLNSDEARRSERRGLFGVTNTPRPTENFPAMEETAR